jgi:hypothetical protein
VRIKTPLFPLSTAFRGMKIHTVGFSVGREPPKTRRTQKPPQPNVDGSGKRSPIILPYQFL